MNALILIESFGEKVYRIVNEEYCDDVEFEAFGGRVIEAGLGEIKLSEAIKLYA